ncbi:MAG: hypothetical protein ACLQVA_05225 [Candidatus Brocadiia bacterium]
MSKTSVRVGKGSFEDHAVITLATRALKMSIVTDAGPRIAFFGKPKGRNLLYWDRQGLGRGEWKLMGGHRVWPTRPGADESEDGYRADNGKCSAQVRGDSVTVISALDPVFNTKRGITVRVAGENRVEVENFVENQGPMLYSCGTWALTCTLPAEGTAYGIPLGDGSDWDCFKLVLFKTWGGGHTSGFDDDQVSFTPDMLLVHPKGRETKRMLQAQRGIIAMDAPDSGCTFAKRTGYDRSASYPLGCNMAFYVGAKNFMVEMETMGPELALKSGQRAVNRETWALTDSAIGLRDAARLIGLFPA